MQGSFTRGLVIGSLIGASLSIMANSNMVNGRTKKRMMRTGRNIWRRSGNLIGDVVDMFR